MVDAGKGKWSSGLITWIVSNDFIRLDDVATELFGYQGQSLEGISVNILMASVSEKHRSRVSQSLHGSVSKGEFFEEEFEVVVGSAMRTLVMKGRAVGDILFTGIVAEKEALEPRGLVQMCLKAYDVAREENNDAAALHLIGTFSHIAALLERPEGSEIRIH